VDALEPPPAADGIDLFEQARRIFGGDDADVGEIR